MECGQRSGSCVFLQYFCNMREYPKKHTFMKSEDEGPANFHKILPRSLPIFQVKLLSNAADGISMSIEGKIRAVLRGSIGLRISCAVKELNCLIQEFEDHPMVLVLIGKFPTHILKILFLEIGLSRSKEYIL